MKDQFPNRRGRGGLQPDKPCQTELDQYWSHRRGLIRHSIPRELSLKREGKEVSYSYQYNNQIHFIYNIKKTKFHMAYLYIVYFIDISDVLKFNNYFC